MLENAYQARLIKKLERKFPGCVVLKNDSSYRQGIPDLLVLFRDKWAALEVKASIDSDIQPNQPYWVELMDSMSYAAFIYPENEEDVFHDLQESFELDRCARVPQR